MEAAKESKLKKLLHLIRSAENKWHTLLSLIPHVYMDLHELKHTQHTHAPPQIIHTHMQMLCDCVPGKREGGSEGEEVQGPDLHSHFQPGDLHPGHLGHIITAIFCLFIPSFTGA